MGRVVGGELRHVFKAFWFDKRVRPPLWKRRRERERGEKYVEMNSPAGDKVTDHRSGPRLPLLSIPVCTWGPAGEFRNKERERGSEVVLHNDPPPSPK